MRVRLPARRLLLWLLGTLMALALLLVSQPPTPRSQPEQGLASGVVGGRVLPMPADLQAPHRMRVAFQIDDLRQMELSHKTFRAEGRLHLAWDAALNQLMREQEIEPIGLLRFANQVEDWNSVLESTGPVRAAEGGARYLQAFRFEGLFYVNGFDLRSAPFLRVSLPLILEVADDRFSLEGRGVLLDPLRDSDLQRSDGLSMAGFRFVGAGVERALHRLDNPFERSQQTFSRAVLHLEYRTDDLAAALRWILPLLLVMAVVLLAPSLDSDRDELSFGLPSAGLLTLVVLQEGFRSQVPATPYLTFLDQLYAYSYAVAVAMFLLFVWGGNLRASASRVEATGVQQRINRICSVVQISALLGYGVILLGSRLR